MSTPSETTEPMGSYRPLTASRMKDKPWLHPFCQPLTKEAETGKVESRVVQVIKEAKRGAIRWPLLFWGEPGAGKSCAGICMVKRFGGGYWWLAKWCDLWINVSKGHRSFEGESGGCTARTSDLERALDRLNLMVVDEVGASEPTDFQFTRFHEILEAREGKPTVIISNHDVDSLANLYDQRIGSRLRAGTQVEFQGDRRLFT